MKIKQKLVLGIGLLFLMIALLTTLSSVYVHRLSADTKNILLANYNTLDYSRQMLIAVNGSITSQEDIASFESNLIKQRINITESGEKELTDLLAAHFDKLKANPSDTSMVNRIIADLTGIMLVNMNAIERKSFIARETADSAIFWIALAGTVCFLIAFTLLINLPGNIANPVQELTDSIKAIAAENYTKRVHFEKHNEFGELATAFNTMAQKLEEYKTSNIEKLMMEKKRIETLINNMADPVIGLDDKKHILFMNNVALKISGLQQEQVIGKPVQDISVNNDLIRSLVQDLFNMDNPTREPVKKAPIKIYADNKESYFDKEIIPIKIIPTGEKEEKLIGNVILLQNITPFKELDFAKTNFIATVSHELKTPISSIKMSLQLLENKQIGVLNEEQQSLVDSINDDASRLLKITGELLNMTQVESGTIQLSSLPTFPKEILDYAINANKNAAEQKQIKFDIAIPDNIPMVLADSEKTAWVLTNLISNAIRYSYDHSVIYLKIDNENEQIKFSVTDTGQGIAPQYINKIFDRYFKIPGTKKEGTGLGLNISKEFIEAQGGSITVKSDFASGSAFTVILPIAPSYA
ncbi:MAG: ATP-binding protein [Flavitalea sp.]